jgi:predicted DCC family thiol-disulfide oxidoreductase YuxK
MHTKPVLLYNDECGVCRRIARWVEKSARSKTGQMNLIVTPIGDDPEALRSLNADLGIWDAYKTIHLLLPDGSMKLGGEAVAEVLRQTPRTRWFAWTFATSIFGFRPFQMILNLAYAILADVRPLFGCESCGIPNPWLRPIASAIRWGGAKFGRRRHSSPTAHSASRSPGTPQMREVATPTSWPVLGENSAHRATRPRGSRT